MTKKILYSLFLGSPLVLGCLGGANIASGQSEVIHQWTFDELETAISDTVNTGAAASAGLPTWSALVNSDATTRWATTPEGGALRIAGNGSGTGTLVQSVVSVPGINAGTVRFEWDVSWTLTNSPVDVRETYLINRNEGGGNRFRWTLSNPSGGTVPLMRLNVDGNGFGPVANITFERDGFLMNGEGANLLLRADFVFGAVNGVSGVVGVNASYSYNGEDFRVIDLGAFTPYPIGDLNDLRLHSKGALSETEFLEFNGVTITRLEEGEPPQPPEPVTLPDLGEPVHFWAFDEAQGTDITGTANTGSAATGGSPTFTAGNEYGDVRTFTTDDQGRLVINGWSNNNVVQTLASLGRDVTGEAWFRWDIDWDYSGTPVTARRVFMNHRSEGGPTAQDNIIRFSLENNNSTTVTLGMTGAVTGGENFNVLNRNLGMAGSLSMMAAVFWDAENQIVDMRAFYSEDEVEFFEIALPDFEPFASNPLTGYEASNLGDILFNAVGDYTGDNFFRLRSLAVYLPTGDLQTPFASWQAAQGFATEEEGAIHADPDGDGIRNVVEYALGLNALSPDRSSLPLGAVENVGGENFLTLAVNRNTEATDAVLTVEVSSDLVIWDSGESHTTVISDTADLLKVRDNTPLTGAGKRFIRLNVGLVE